MPTLDGPSFLRKIRGKLELKQPHFIFITGGVNVDFEEGHSLSSLSDGYLYKPFRESAIQEILETLMSKLEERKAA